MAINQISVFVENRPGAMHALTEVLARNNIDMRALSLAETSDFGIVRIIVDDVYATSTTLRLHPQRHPRHRRGRPRRARRP